MVSPPTAAATTGVPVACASTATSPKDSLYDGTHDQRRRGVPVGELGWATGGTNRTTSSMPSAAASWTSDSGCSRPVPEGPPTTGTTEPVAQRRVSLEQRGTARSSTSGAFSGWIRPANISTTASRGSPSRARGAVDDGRNTVEVDAGVHHLDAGRVRVVQLEQLLGLEVGVRDQHVRGLDDLLLADHPGGGSGVSPLASDAFLTLAIVCIECTSGTLQRSRASAPTCPESQ